MVGKISKKLQLCVSNVIYKNKPNFGRRIVDHFREKNRNMIVGSSVSFGKKENEIWSSDRQ